MDHAPSPTVAGFAQPDAVDGDDVLNVACIAFPDGTVQWVLLGDDLGEPARERISSTMDRWRAAQDPERVRAIEEAHCLGGSVFTRIRREDFETIAPELRLPRGTH